MGLTRKILSISTAGLVDLRSDKERIALYSRQTRNAVREQNRIAAGGEAGPARKENPITGMRTIGPSWGDVAARLRPPTESVEQAIESTALPAPALPVGATPPPGWYADNADPALNRWWDGQAWTEATLPRA